MNADKSTALSDLRFIGVHLWFHPLRFTSGLLCAVRRLLTALSAVSDSDVTPETPDDATKTPPRKRKRRWFRRGGILFLVVVFILVCLRLAMPTMVTWYVSRTIDQSPLY